MPEFKVNKNNITKADIKQWEEDLLRLPVKIQKSNTDIKTYQEKIKQLEPELKSIDVQIAPIDTLIEAISARIEIIESTSKIKKLEAKIPSHQAVVDKLNPQLAEVSKILNPINKEIDELERVIRAKETQVKIQDLQSKIAQQNSILPTLDSSHNITKVTLDSCHAEIQQLTARIRSLESRNSADETTMWANNLGRMFNPQPQAVAISQSQPQPIAIRQPQPVACYDPNSEIRANIASRRCEISQLNATLAIKRSAQTTYEQEVRKLKSERQRCQSEIDSLKSQLSSSERDLSCFSYQEIAWANREDYAQLKVKLQQHQTLRAPHEQERKALYEEISEHRSIIESLENSIARLKERIDFLTNKANDFAEIIDTADLNIRLDQQRAFKKPLSAERTRLSSEIAKENENIRLARSDISAYEATLVRHHANQALINLRDNPQGAFDHLAQAMRDQLADYDYKFPAYQTYKVRAYLKDFEENILRIKNLNLPVKQMDSNGQVFLLDNPSFLKYLMLCGSFWQMVDEIKIENPHVASLIREALRNCNFDPLLCKDIYAPYHVMPLSENQLNTYEQKKYEETRKQFFATLDTLPVEDKKFKQLHELGLKIIDKVDIKIATDIDIKYATLMLENSNNLALHPSNVDFQQKQRLLANHIPEDKSAAKKKCKGILLMFLGAAIAIGSGVACMASPFAAIGVGVGAVTFVAGLSLFRSGRKDLTRTMNNFERTAKEIDESPPPYVAVNVSVTPSAPVLAPDLVDKRAFSRLR